ncbi:MAG: LOG family protein [Planctomycetes bacterium]|nr:LOG family protein [Planctomycetota bacterium]
MSEAPELDNSIRARITALVADAAATASHRGGDSASRRRRHVEELVSTGLKLLSDGCDISQIKLIENAVKEIRRSYRVFNRFRGVPKVSIFGSARTPMDHPDYIAARSFGQAMAAEHWMAITGAGDGIMKAGHEGPSRESSFGLSIRLPFETNANEIIAGDDKLVSFKYFFTRKLMFVSHSDAVAVFPGGFGTMDEIFEVLTLIQTGKSPIVPIVLVEGADKEGKPLGYWRKWEYGVVENLLAQGWISAEDPGLYEFASSPADAVARILRFYHRYHSSRYVGDQLVIRLKRPLLPAQVELLDGEFRPLIKSGHITQTGALDAENEHPDLPRLQFHYSKRAFGLLRRLIDRINHFPEDPATLPSS